MIVSAMLSRQNRGIEIVIIILNARIKVWSNLGVWWRIKLLDLVLELLVEKDTVMCLQVHQACHKLCHSHCVQNCVQVYLLSQPLLSISKEFLAIHPIFVPLSVFTATAEKGADDPV